MTMKEYSKELWRVEVLYYLWDPGVSLTPEARAEYEGCVLQVVEYWSKRGVQNSHSCFQKYVRKHGLPENITKDLDTQLLQDHKGSDTRTG
jgi:hypothetical protein